MRDETSSDETPEAQDRDLLVEAAKFCVLAFAAFEEHIDQDYDLAHILFVLILRTHEDAGALSKTRRSGIGRLQGENGLLITANIYEIAKYTGMNRATVRRKMHKLAELGLITRLAHERWILGGDEAAGEKLCGLVEALAHAQEAFASSAAFRNHAARRSPSAAPATEERLRKITMSPREARKKIGKGAFHVRAQPVLE